MPYIDGKDITFSYSFEGSRNTALEGVNFSCEKGELVCIVGRNGSGKSTLVRLFNALLPMQGGRLTVGGINVHDSENVWRLRRMCGMIFQNPDNQFVSSVLEEDVAFGLENYMVPEEEIPEKVSSALSMVGLAGFEKRAPHTLSGGQKQRAALAGVLVLEPEIIILDEATAMLDPEGRRQVLEMAHTLHGDGRTVIMITHYVEEAVYADKVYLMDKGKIIASGSPREVLTDKKLINSAGMTLPTPAKAYYDFLDRGIQLKNIPLTEAELAEELSCLLN